jgi:hypothetical protein
MRPPATSTPAPTLIKRNQRYAGSQIAVAATIAAAATSAAVPRIGSVTSIGYAGLGLILTSLNAKPASPERLCDWIGLRALA